MANAKLIMENWRRFIKEEEAAPAPEAGAVPPAGAPESKGSWPSEPTKKVPITAGSNLTREQIMQTWKNLAAMNPPQDPEKTLADIGGPDALVANVKDLEGNMAGSESNPPRIDMPHVDPKKGDIEDLGGRLEKGQLDVKKPFAKLEEVAYDMPDKFPTGLDKADQPTQDRFLTKGLRDNSDNDDNSVKMGPSKIDVKNSYPTQNAIYLDKCMWNILNFGPTKKGGLAHGGPNLIAIQTSDGKNFILDGHHRWGGAWISGGAGAKINVQVLKGLDIPTAIAALRAYGNARDNPQKD